MHCAAKTGRLRCREPNVQQLEADSRHAVEAPAGSLLVWADLGQIEARVEAELAPDPELRAVFADGRCVHCITAAATHGVPEDAIAREGDPRRDAAKPIVYGTIYGAGPARLAATAFKKYKIEMSLEEARHGKNAFLTRFPGRCRLPGAHERGAGRVLDRRPAACVPNGKRGARVSRTASGSTSRRNRAPATSC